MNSYPPLDWINHAVRTIYSETGAQVSPAYKNKDLIKFGRNADVERDAATVMTLPSGIDNETYVATDLITSVVSTDAGDTTDLTIEGHTVDGNGDFTFSIQTITLTGQTVATLATPLARVSRAYANGAVDLLGEIAVCEDDTYTAGVPDTAAGVHLMIRAGQNQSEKCSTTLSQYDYWVITGIYANMLTKQAAFAEVWLEVRRKGMVFRQVVDLFVSDHHRASQNFTPYVVVYPNSDVRLRAISDSGTGRDVSGGIIGVLMKAQS